MPGPTPDSPPAIAPVTLYHLAPSHYCEKARRILEWKGIPFTLVNVPYGDHREVLRVSGQDYVPYVVTSEGAGILWPDIADWAEHVAPAPTLYPSGRAAARLLEHWAHQVVEEAAWKVALPDIARIFRDPYEAWIFEEMQVRKRGPLAVMKQRQPDFLADLTGILALVEEVLDGQPWLQGAGPSVADFALYGSLRPLELAGADIPPSLARTRDWYARAAAVGSSAQRPGSA